VARVSSSELPSLVRALHGALTVLQLEGVLLPPVCSGGTPSRPRSRSWRWPWGSGPSLRSSSTTAERPAQSRPPYIPRSTPAPHPHRGRVALVSRHSTLPERRCHFHAPPRLQHSEPSCVRCRVNGRWLYERLQLRSRAGDPCRRSSSRAILSRLLGAVPAVTAQPALLQRSP